MYVSVKVLLVEKHLAKRVWCCGASLSVDSMLVEKRIHVHV